MYTNNELLSLFERHIAQMPTPEEPQRLYAPIKYGLEEGGKRIRPTLLMLAYNLYAEDIERALMPAMAVEIFHNFTLLHDDIMDNAAVRRGRPSVPAKWGDNVAILSGDAMLILAYTYLQRTNSERLSQIFERFNKMAAEVCEGQQFDMDFETQQKVSVVDYMRMIELKTAALLAGSAIIGAILAGASDGDCKRLYDFAREVGLAFQLQDDLLDSYGDERLGKKIGGDILEGKKTILMIEAFSRANEEQREVLRTTHLRKDLSDAEKISTIKALYDELGVPERVEQQIAQKFQKALGILDTLEVPQERTVELRHYAENLVGRKS
ncbi:MAG: polyprenyl synthetase family protein [Rikenellaceae bacterium]|nr:polyprenyl synthetase family protein [Rikenellaceae bacterium]